tara:strand:+ start:188 stop:544 length:357 start_codon:yes stop_codon:yes gene_type:complete
MNILTNPLRVIFFFYLFFLYYSYVRPVEPTINKIASVVSDDAVHFIAFFILGALAQLANNKLNDFVFGISLALITSIFIEFIHFFIPFRDFQIIEGILNALGCLSAIFLISYYRKNYG